MGRWCSFLCAKSRKKRVRYNFFLIRLSTSPLAVKVTFLNLSKFTTTNYYSFWRRCEDILASFLTSPSAFSSLVYIKQKTFNYPSNACVGKCSFCICVCMCVHVCINNILVPSDLTVYFETLDPRTLGFFFFFAACNHALSMNSLVSAFEFMCSYKFELFIFLL